MRISFLTTWRLLDDGRDRSEFYRMWRAGAAAGFTVPKTLETMGPRAAPHVELLRLWLLEGTREGKDVAHLVRLGRSRFDAFESAMLLLGDESGTLENSLALLADFYARKHRLMLAVRKQMAYPLFTGIFATLIAPFPLLYFGHTIAYLATAIEAGLPLPRAVRLAADASANEDIKAFMRTVDEPTLASQPITVTLANCPHMTPDFLAVLQVAERTGDYRTSLARLADSYEDGFR